MITGIIKVNDELFTVKRTTNLNYESLAPEWRSISPNHRMFKQNDRLFFCELIEEIEFAEDIVGNPII